MSTMTHISTCPIDRTTTVTTHIGGQYRIPLSEPPTKSLPAPDSRQVSLLQLQILIIWACSWATEGLHIETWWMLCYQLWIYTDGEPTVPVHDASARQVGKRREINATPKTMCFIFVGWLSNRQWCYIPVLSIPSFGCLCPLVAISVHLEVNCSVYKERMERSKCCQTDCSS